MKKNILLSIMAVFLMTAYLSAQNCEVYMEFKKGRTFTYKYFDKKGDETSTCETKIINVSKEGNTSVANLHFKNVPVKAKEKPTEADYYIKCDGSKIYVDLRGMLAGIQNIQGMEVTISSKDMEYPTTMQVGSLPDATMTIECAQNGNKMMTMDFIYKDRQIVGKETITTEAGTFECYKMTYTVENKSKMALGIGLPTVTINAVEYFAKGKGMIKSEQYRKGKLQSSSTLVKVVDL